MHAVLRGHYRFGLVILLLLAVAFVLRLHNLSSYNLYPDSYQNLVVAHNLATSHNPVGPMGPDGMYYPDFFSWTRPLYPLLIIAGSWFTSAEAAAHIIATGASLVAVVVLTFYSNS